MAHPLDINRTGNFPSYAAINAVVTTWKDNMPPQLVEIGQTDAIEWFYATRSLEQAIETCTTMRRFKALLQHPQSGFQLDAEAWNIVGRAFLDSSGSHLTPEILTLWRLGKIPDLSNAIEKRLKIQLLSEWEKMCLQACKGWDLHKTSDHEQRLAWLLHFSSHGMTALIIQHFMKGSSMIDGIYEYGDEPFAKLATYWGIKM